MTSILEVPITNSVEGSAEEPQAAPEVTVVVAKKRGRPKGAPNKPKATPAPAPAPPPAATVPKKQPKKPTPSDSEEERVPVKAKRKRVPSPPSSDEEPPKPRRIANRSRQRTISPTPVVDTRQVASEVLQLLSDRHLNQTAARRDKYRSWFQ